MPRPAPTPNLADAVRKAAKTKGRLSEDELAHMAMCLLFETGSDTDGVHAHRGRLKLDAIKFLHQLNEDSKAPTESADSDVEILRLLNERRARRTSEG